MRLINQTKNLVLTEKLVIASSLVDRFLGWMGKDSVEDQSALLIRDCRSIHTHFMKFSIDAVFIAKDGSVKKILWNYKPWKISLPVWTANEVIEFTHGHINKEQIALGDRIYVET